MRAAAVAERRHSAPGFAPPARPLRPLPMSQEARLAVWASLLERRDALAQIKELDRCDDAAAMALRRDGSAASVAFADPALRAAGLRGDSVGDICAFFGLTPRQCHRLLCACGAAPILRGSDAASALRRLARQPRLERARLNLCLGLSAGLLGLLGLRLVTG